MYIITKKQRRVGSDIELLDWYDEVGRNEYVKFDNEKTDLDEQSIEEIEADMDATYELLDELGADAIADELNQSIIPTYLQMNAEAPRLELRYVNGEIVFDHMDDSVKAELLNIADHLDAKLLDAMGNVVS